MVLRSTPQDTCGTRYVMEMLVLLPSHAHPTSCFPNYFRVDLTHR